MLFITWYALTAHFSGWLKRPNALGGIIFAKYHFRSDSHGRSHIEPRPPSDLLHAPSGIFAQWVKELLVPEGRLINPTVYGGRLFIYVGLLLWGSKFLSIPMETNYVGESFMHLINLPFHEAGHLVFRPLGRFMHVLGGSLGQLLMPFVCLGALLIQNRDGFGAAVGLWWFAESVMILRRISTMRERSTWFC